MKKVKPIELIEIFSVMFEHPLHPGHWSEPLGRFRTKIAAATWGGKRSHTVTFSLLLPGEKTRFSRASTLEQLDAALIMSFRQ